MGDADELPAVNFDILQAIDLFIHTKVLPCYNS